jgi:GNAT superfamily N-acetyltransferase
VPVADRETLKHWVHVASIGFGVPAASEGRWCDLFADLVFALPMRCYLATLNGEPVGTSQLFLGAGVAGLYSVTCIPAARRRGVGAAVTLAALRDARELGYGISILQASDLGYGVYRRLGFEAYGRLNQYLWEDEMRPPGLV